MSVTQGLVGSAVAAVVAGAKAAGVTAGALCGMLLAAALVAVSEGPAFPKDSSSVVAEGVGAAATGASGVTK